MISVEVLVDLLGIRKNYRSYAGSLDPARPAKLNVLSDLGRPGKRGWLTNDDTTLSFLATFNGGEPVEVMAGERIPLDYLVIETVLLRAAAGSPTYRMMVW